MQGIVDVKNPTYFHRATTKAAVAANVGSHVASIAFRMVPIRNRSFFAYRKV